jgi:hypothetical protein
MEKISHPPHSKHHDSRIIITTVIIASIISLVIPVIRIQGGSLGAGSGVGIQGM